MTSVRWSGVGDFSIGVELVTSVRWSGVGDFSTLEWSW